jgi:hypothetical protein
MSSIQRITNKEPLIEKKVNYFLDRISHSINYAGSQEQLELETPVSLIGKVLFRLQNDTDDRLEYFDSYFKRPFFTTDTFWEDNSIFVSIKKTIADYNKPGQRKCDKINILRNPAFAQELEQLHGKLKKEMPKDLMTGALQIIRCPHDLHEPVEKSNETHASLFSTIAMVLVSQYYFNGFTKGEIFGVISDVFSKTVNDFPFPAGIVTKEEKQQHLAEGTLENQLHGFANAFDQPLGKNIVLLKVYGGRFPPAYKFPYNKVTFFGKDHAELEAIKEKMSPDDKDFFFTEGDYLLAAVEISWRSGQSLLAKAVTLIKSELTILSGGLGRDFSPDNTNNYLLLSPDFEYSNMAWSTQKYDSAINESLLEELNDNAYKALRNAKGASVNWFLECEALFVWAHKNKSIADYWLYLEVLLSYNRPSKEVKELISSILLLNEKSTKDNRILQTLYDIFCAPLRGPGLLNIPFEEFKEVRATFHEGEIPSKVRAFNYPFTQELIEELDAPIDAKKYTIAKKYYYSILTEAYAHRNFYVHSGMENEVLKAKLSVTLPNIVIRLRRAIFEALNNPKETKPFDQIVDMLSANGNALLQS